MRIENLISGLVFFNWLNMLIILVVINLGVCKDSILGWLLWGIGFCWVQDEAAAVFTLADGSIADWFSSFIYTAGQQANVAVQDQLSALSFTRFFFLYFTFNSYPC